MKKPIIIDTDPGIDDAIALFLAIASEKLDVKLISTVAGNLPVERVSANALKLIRLAGAEHIEVAKGADRPLFRELFTADDIHGPTGLGNAELTAPGLSISSRSSLEAMTDILSHSEEKVTIIAIGPLTNIAILIKSHPEVLSNIQEISIMGGASQGGNVTPVAEFNMFVDPEAAKIVFESGLPITMFGLDVTHRALLFREDIEKIRTIKSDISEITAQMLDFYAGRQTDGLPMHDACAVAHLIDPTLFTTVPCHVVVETKGEFTSGQTVVDQRPGQPTNANVAFDVDKQRLSDMIFQAIETLSKR